MQTATYAHAATNTTIPVAPIPATRVWAGRSLSALVILFMLFDGVIKVLRLPAAVDGAVQLGYRADSTFGIGVLLLICVAFYLIPRTAPLGALLLTGYLGGAVATHVRFGSPLFSVVFPVLLGALLWGGLALRERRVRALLSLQP